MAVPSLVALCTKTLCQNIDSIGSLETALGTAPYHLMKPIFKRATRDQLEYILQWNPDMIEDTDELWKAFVVKDYADVRRAVEQPDFKPPDSWRDYWKMRKEEVERRLELTRQKLNKRNKALEEQKEKKKILVLEKPLQTKQKSFPFGSAIPVKKENKYFKAAKREMAKRRI
ncbi:Elongin-A [Chytridiales sp. JEL 0842]|nr:Elongin-A [Chytridiales sp. JEL 0842]